MSTQDDALPEPVAFMWMHDETGRIGFVDVWQLKNGWQQANPRCKVKRPLFAADQMHAAIARERAQADALRTVMIAAAEEIAAHWDAHCDAEGYGPQNLMRRLEEGIPSEYGYTAGRFAELQAELSTLRRWKSTHAPRIAALEGLKNHAQAEAAQGKEARATMKSERAANAVLTEENEALRQQLAEAVRDAERYLYLRNRAPESVLGVSGRAAGCWIDCDNDLGTVLVLLTGHDADAAIDAAIAAGAQK